MLSQVRSGGIDFFTPSALVVATLVPVAAINAVGFAFSDYGRCGRRWTAVWRARAQALAKMRLHAFEKMWDNGFRQTTTSNKPIQSAADMSGMKIRVPVSPLSIAMFKGLGAAPASLQFSEVYSALQTRIVDAQENPLPIIQVAKLYEVQKYCSLTNHIWDGFWFIANGASWEPPAARSAEDRRRRDQRRRPEAARGHQKLNRDGAGRPRGQGLQFNAPSRTASAPRCARPALRRLEEALRRRGLGPARAGGRQARLRPWAP